MVQGLRNKIQKAAPSIKGTHNIINMVLTGPTPNDRKIAYEDAPTIPAPPVPELHVEITFLILFGS